MLNKLSKVFLLGSLTLCLSILCGTLARADSPSQPKIYLAEINGVSIFIAGVTHGSNMPPPTPAVENYFEKSALVFTEFDFTNQNHLQRTAQQLRDGKKFSVANFLTDEEVNLTYFAWQKKFDGKASMTPSTLGKLNACGLSLFLLPVNRVHNTNFDSTKKSSWEQIYVLEAKAKSKPVVELEPNGSMYVCSEMEAAQVRSFVVEAANLALNDDARNTYLTNIELSRKSFEAGDDAKGYSHFLNALSANQKFASSYLNYIKYRNRSIINVIESERLKLATGTNCFLMVGSLHLYGDDGVLSLLKAKGYQVSKL